MIDLKGCKVLTPEGKKGIVKNHADGFVVLESSEIWPDDLIKVIERPLYQSRLAKPIEDMTEEELREHINNFRRGRVDCMTNSRIDLGRKGGKKKKEESDEPSKPKAKRKSTAKAPDFSVLEGLLNPEDLAILKLELLSKSKGE